ncbi:MAG: carboxypeptidase M32 [Deltaproteobacteria bacterium]|nr:MAG: carboxypeptidase M32 [Deltaproteobacteria bacterium]
MTPSAYDRLTERFRRLNALTGSRGVLGWDMATMMPDGGAEARAEQLEVLTMLGHGLLTAPEVSEWLAEAESAPPDDPWDTANLREMRRAHLHATCVDENLVGALSRATSRCEMRWRAARPDNDFQGLLPSLDEVLRLTREVAEHRAAVLGCSAYEALMDEYEPGAREETIDALFDDLAGWLPNTVDRIVEKQEQQESILPIPGPFPQAKQEALCRRLLGLVGFDFAHGRLDTSHHPFCGGVPDDVRITTRYREDDFVQSVMGVLHECGHALYERGLPAPWRSQPVGGARGMALHESQSLLIEMQACRSPEFISCLAPLVREAFDGDGPEWSEANLRRIYGHVQRSLIRVDADEVTYPAHVILRYRLERALIRGDLQLADLPGAWADGLDALLGIRPPDDRQGCLQDIHWPSGGWGYFPTYTLGALAAAQLFERACADRPDIPSELGRGDFRGLLGWLRTHVHQRASFTSTDEVLRDATGSALATTAFKAHVERRYLVR